MIYTDYQFYRLQYLLRKYRIYKLSDNEIDELRELVKMVSPDIDNNKFSIEEIVKLGLITVGMITLIRILRDEK